MDLKLPADEALARMAGALRRPVMTEGHPFPLGATWDGIGVNFAVFSAHATKVELCLFDSADSPTESARLALPEQTDMVWHGYLAGIRPGQIYGPYTR